MSTSASMSSEASRTGQATVLVMVPASVEEVPDGAAGHLWVVPVEVVHHVAEVSEDSDTVPFITDYSSYNSCQPIALLQMFIG